LVKRQHVKRDIVINSLSEGNMELADYVAHEIDSVDNAFISDLLVVKDGASMLQNIGSRMDIKNHVVDELNNLNPDDTVGEYFDTNVKELLEKNFICGSEICYKV
jgi:cephalosporin hydroxylase